MQPLDLLKLKVKVPDDSVWRATCDWQVGNAGWADDLVEELLRPVLRDPKYRLVCIGDMIDAITAKDKRFSWQDLDPRFPTPQLQRKEVVRRLRPVAKKGRLIGIGMGNHEDARNEDGDPTLDMCEALGTNYLGYTALVRVNQTSTLLFWHGKKSLAPPDTMKNSFDRNMHVKRKLYNTNYHRFGKTAVDGIFQGHVNQLAVVAPWETRDMEMHYDWDQGELSARHYTDDPRWYGVCGSLQRGYAKGRALYPEKWGLKPLPLGCVDIHFRKGRIFAVEPVVLG